ncbi:MAG: lysophospholipid acyltransferase family protein [Spirochaetota bacterium]|nr:lysophospholipid acyltransferase family protein [Spirochaetota bacterium]
MIESSKIFFRAIVTMKTKRIQYTMFNTPIVKHILRALAFILRTLLGWKKVGRLPDFPKYLAILAFHTSNWDVFYGILIAFGFNVDIYFMAKNQLFRFPFAPLVRFLGGIPIDRSVSSNTVQATIDMYNKHEKFAIALAPEGTRKKVEKWKTGFYHIATGAHIPIILAFLDYKTKSGGIGAILHPTGDIKTDFKTIRDFYTQVHARYPELASLPQEE